jgi:hypothetical protein
MFSERKKGELLSFLIDITAVILKIQNEQGDGYWVNPVVDNTWMKGTRKWTVIGGNIGDQGSYGIEVDGTKSEVRYNLSKFQWSWLGNWQFALGDWYSQVLGRYECCNMVFPLVMETSLPPQVLQVSVMWQLKIIRRQW